MKAQGREKTDNGARMPARDLGQRRVLRDRPVRQRIKALPDAREPALAHQTGQGDARQTADIQVQGSDKPPVTGKR